MKQLVQLSLVSLIALVMIGCGGNSKKNEEESKAKTADLESFSQEVFEYPIPHSYTVTRMLQEANASYVYHITNKTENASNYVTTWQKALNLGVYGADLSYSSQYNRQEETMQFLEVSRKLIEDLNIGTAFTESMANRMERNIDDKDSLILIVMESFEKTYSHLNRNGEEKTSLLVVAGSVIEGLHITAQLIISSDYNDQLMEVMAGQKVQVKKLVELMDAHADDENVNRVLPTLRFIDLFYDQLGDDTKISQGQFNDIYDAIRDMRNSIVG